MPTKRKTSNAGQKVAKGKENSTENKKTKH
jgi:hypothetical protein